MMKKLLFVASFVFGLAFCFIAGPQNSAQGAPLFFDDFNDNVVLTNTGAGNVGGGWTTANQAALNGSFPHAESGSVLSLHSAGTSPFNVGGLKTQNTFALNSVVTTVINDLHRVSGTGNAARVPFTNAQALASVNVVSSLNTAPFTNAFNHQGHFALTVEIIRNDDAPNKFGFAIRRDDGSAPNGDNIPTGFTGVFDSAISDTSPLTVSIQINDDSTFSVWFSHAYDTGQTAAKLGSFVNLIPEDSQFRVAIGAQSPANPASPALNFAVAKFGSVQISPIPEPATGAMLAAVGLMGLFLGRKRHMFSGA